MRVTDGTPIKAKIKCANCGWEGFRKTYISGYLHAQIARLIGSKMNRPCPKCRYPVEIISCEVK